MRWIVDKWEIAGMMVMDSKGGTSEIKIKQKIGLKYRKKAHIETLSQGI